jgi:sulfate transport system ATP-binding protein
LLAIVQLPGYEKRFPRDLSGGEKQRVAFARALAIDPLVLALDEPFAALDAAVRRTLRTWLRDAPARATAATLLVTHDADEAMAVADRVVIVGAGRVEGEGTPANLYARPPSLAAMRALGAAEAFAGGFVRPHDLRIGGATGDGAIAATVVRTVPLGGRTRLELALDDGTRVTAERDDAEFASTSAGTRVDVRASYVHRFA